jgi:catechol 2,3-dioxygenase-like lactoylglutathione lyase family enzyme
MPLSITHTPVYCTDLDAALAFYTQLLGFEVHEDVPMGPEMRWLTLRAPGDTHELLLAAITEILQEPTDQPYGVRDAGVRDPNGNHLRLSQPLAKHG